MLLLQSFKILNWLSCYLEITMLISGDNSRFILKKWSFSRDISATILRKQVVIQGPRDKIIWISEII